MKKSILINVGLIFAMLCCALSLGAWGYFHQPNYGKNDFSGYHKLDYGLEENYCLLNHYRKTNCKFTLVLYKTGCIDCYHAQKLLVYEIKKSRLTQNVIVIDIHAMSNKQLTKFKEDYPELLYQKYWISTPTVAKVKFEHNKLKVLAIENHGDINKMMKLLRKR